MNSQLDDRFEFARSRIIQEQMFFAVLMMSRKWEEFDNPRAAMATDGESIFYNVKECSTFTQIELQGVIVHELFHIFGKHHLRMGNRDQETWSMACDYAINPALLKMGIVLPPTKFIREDFENKSAEEIYNTLMKEKEDGKDNSSSSRNEPRNRNGKESEGSRGSEPKKGKGKQKVSKEAVLEKKEGIPDGGFDYIKPPPKVMSQAEISEKETEINIILSQAMRISKQAGKFSADMERVFESLRETETNWREELRNYIQVLAKNDYTWMYPNKRYIHKSLYLPSLRSMEIGKVVLVIDSSGSIDKVLYAEFLSQMRSLLEEMKITATVIFCDAKVKGVIEDVYPEDIENLKIEGGGGTNFIPPFEYLEEQEETPTVLIYFTDLKCSSYPVEPDYPIIWAVYGNKVDRTVPFGQVIDIH